MSYDYNLSTIDNAPNSFCTFKKAKGRDKKTTDYRDGPIEWSIEKGNFIYQIIKKIPYPRRMLLPDLGEDSYEIHKFLISLDGFEESEGSETSMIPWVIKCTCLLGGVFAKTLKRYRQDRFINTIIGRYSNTEIFTRKWDRNLTDIGEIFNYAYLPHWKASREEVKDYEYGFIEVNQKPQYLEKFSSALEEILNETKEVEEIKKEEILIKISASKSFNQKDYSSDYNWILKEKGSNLSSSIGLCKRCIIDIGPDNIRDTILTQPDSLNTINLIDRQTMEVIQDNEKNYMVNKHLLKEKRISRIKNFDAFAWYFMRDIKKEGITKPKNLLKLMIRGLHKRFPQFEAYQFEDFYEGFSILFEDGSIKEPIRGHGLGMANSLTTLMQLVIDRMISNQLIADGFEFEYDTLVINDDHVAVFRSETDLDEFDNIDYDILEGLGLIRNQEKSIVSQRGFILCERYFKTMENKMNFKESYIRRECLLPLLARNIVEAKRIVNSLVRHDNVELMMSYMREFVDLFGYEFFPEEANYPVLCGGWLSFNIAGVKLDLIELDKQWYGPTVYKAYQACKNDRISIRTYGKDRPYNSPLLRIYPFLCDEEVVDLITGTTRRKVIDKFFRFSDNPKLEDRAWENLRKKRKKVFQETENKSLLREDFYSLIYLENKSLFYPPDILIKKLIYLEFKGELPIDLYLSACPLLSAIACSPEYRQCADLDEKYSIQFPVSDSFSFFTGNARALSQKLALTSDDIFFPDMAYEPDYYIPDNEYDLVISEWFNPGRIARASEFLSGNATIPIVSCEMNKEVLELKKSVYGRILRQDEITYFSINRMGRREMRFLVQIRDEADPDFKMLADEIFDDALYQLYIDNLIPQQEKKVPKIIEFDVINNIKNSQILYNNEWMSVCPFFDYFSATSSEYKDFNDLVRSNYRLITEIKRSLIKGRDRDSIKKISFLLTQKFVQLDKTMKTDFLHSILLHTCEQIRIIKYPEKKRTRFLRICKLIRIQEDCDLISK